MCVFTCVCVCERERESVCVHVCIESSAPPGKGMPAKWQMVGINLAKSLSPSTSTPPTWLPTLPRVYFPPRTRSAHCLLRRIFSPHLPNSPARWLYIRFKQLCFATPYATLSLCLHRPDYVRYRFPKRKYHWLKTNKLKEQDARLSLKIGSDPFEVWVIKATPVVVGENDRCLDFHSLLANSKRN